MTRKFVVALVCAMGLAATAQAQNIARELLFTIHETPGDEDSDVVMTIEMDLEQVAVNANSAGWEIVSITFREYDDDEDVVGKWTTEYPETGLPNNEWWIDHADTSAPKADEFHAVPLLVGTATDVSGITDLDYEFSSREYEGSNPPFGDETVTMTYVMQYEGAATPYLDEEDEPVKFGAGGTSG